MEIKQMSLAKPVGLAELVPGEVYGDPYGRYVIATDGFSVVDLETGDLHNTAVYYLPEDPFVPVKAILEIK